MDFTIVIPSRNRAGLLRQAIESVLAQTHPAVEVIVANDGSDGDQAVEYAGMASEWPERVRFLDLEPTPRGHGPSYAINRGVDAARGLYVGFLDDDDVWTDPEHLARAWRVLTDGAPIGDLYFANQRAWRGDRLVEEDLWLSGLRAHLEGRARPDAHGAYRIDADLLMNALDGKFNHLNTTLVRRALYLQIQGMDEHIRYECEWDLYLRLLAAATRIDYHPGVVARHNVPDPAKAVNVSTGMPVAQKLLFRGMVLDKAIAFSERASIRRMAARHRIYTSRRLATLLAGEKRFEQAAFHARQAVTGPLDVKWWLYAAYLSLKR